MWQIIIVWETCKDRVRLFQTSFRLARVVHAPHNAQLLLFLTKSGETPRKHFNVFPAFNPFSHDNLRATIVTINAQNYFDYKIFCFYITLLCYNKLYF